MKPKVRSHITVVPITGSVTIGGTSRTAVEIKDKDHIIENLLKFCNGKNDINNIAKEMMKIYSNLSVEDVKGYISQLSEIPYIFEDEELYINDTLNNERNSRSLNFLSNFDYYGNKKTEYLSNIQNSTILIVGLGGAGTNFVLNMASWGVKRIIGIDYDTVELSNLNRQLIFRESDIGKKKTLCTKHYLKNINSKIEFIGIDKLVDSYEFVKKIIKKYNCDYVLCSADTPPIKILEWCNKASQETKIPFSYTGMGEYITTFETIIPGETSCYNCYENYIKETPAFEKYQKLMSGNYGAQNDCIFANSSLAAAYLTFDVIKLLGKLPNCNIMSLGKRVNIDHITNKITIKEINMSSNCKYCHANKTRP